MAKKLSKNALNALWHEMARRKLAFHANEDWKEVILWGLFPWGVVSALLESGELLTTMCKENRTVWVYPSTEAYYEHIKPILDSHILVDFELVPKPVPTPPDLWQQISSPWSRSTGRIRRAYVTYDPSTGELKQVSQDPNFEFSAGRGLTRLPGYTVTASEYDETIRLAERDGVLIHDH